MVFVATPESIAKMRASQKARLADPAERAKYSGPRLASRKPKSAAHCEALRQSWTPERRATHAERMRGNNRWQSKRKETGIEKQTREWLDELGLTYEQHHQVCGFWVDFFVEGRIVVECDGTFWHSRDGVPERDAMKDRTWRKAGHEVIRLPEADIKDGSAVHKLKDIA